jgi:hypothetical protein
VLRLLGVKFGPLPPDSKSRLEVLSLQQLEQPALDLIMAQSLKELGLQG